MTEKQFRDYKDIYLDDLKEYLLEFLEIWTERKSNRNDKKLNELVVQILSDDFKKIQTLSYFPEYDLPE